MGGEVRERVVFVPAAAFFAFAEAVQIAAGLDAVSPAAAF
jgi:hypothetical protein